MNIKQLKKSKNEGSLQTNNISTNDGNFTNGNSITNDNAKSINDGDIFNFVGNNDENNNRPNEKQPPTVIEWVTQPEEEKKADEYVNKTIESQPKEPEKPTTTPVSSAAVISLYEGALNIICRLINPEFNAELPKENKEELTQLLNQAYPTANLLNPKTVFWLTIGTVTATNIGAAIMTKKVKKDGDN